MVDAGADVELGRLGIAVWWDVYFERSEGIVER